MAIVQCTHCPRYYWSFRSDFPPKGYCSQKCYDERRRAGAKLPPPEAPQNILMAMYRHRLDTHESTSILADFECEECERLEGGGGTGIAAGGNGRGQIYAAARFFAASLRAFAAARDARRAICNRRAGVSLRALASPPFRPSATAAGFLSSAIE